MELGNTSGQGCLTAVLGGGLRYGRFADGEVLRSVFEMVVQRCDEAGLVGGTGALVDGRTVEADTNRDRRAAPAELEAAWAEADNIARPVRAYLELLEAEAAVLQNDLPIGSVSRR